jgi:hypothetical protein
MPCRVMIAVCSEDTLQNTQMHSVGTMSNFLMLNPVVCKLTIGLLKH